ncbi:calcium-responsive transactivator isoform X3 [Nothobranchius furzeri]|uniref:Synovial sarcoma translocation gene on chromosome 18-like 1 n=2 Tax=Nothobranchius TaxID=28779 RepID=A0A1A8UT95_NOTFU|nr:calcium-responsive transactivator isoform X2 [Nothobranchius furzeri]KAF7210189.1 transcript variant X2 [Nothobranchius furzeri]
MSVAFSSARPRSKGEVTQQNIQKMLDENHHLIQCIMDYQSKGKTAECTQYQQILHRNLVYLATIADSNQNIQSLLPAPPSSNMSVGAGGGHAPSNLNDNMTPGLPPTSTMQSQINNVSMMHQQSAPPHYSSAQSGGQHYQGQQAMGMMGQGNQGNSMMSQRAMGSYRSSQQGSAQHYMGQDEFYGDQYGHTQSSRDPVNQQYYADGHGEYSYQQPAYSEQGYDRSFDESSQHYYEGGNSQYGQQQASYQQSSGQQQPFSQPQYSSQQGYSSQAPGYGPGQGGSSQFSQYQQGQNHQFGSYRSTQGGPTGQTQRPYAYEQGHYGNYPQ